MHTVGTV